MNSRTYSGVKPIEPIRCAYEPDKACAPTCIHSLHKQAVYTYIEERKKHEKK